LGRELIRGLNENVSLRRKSIEEAPAVPQPIAALNPRKITHRFRRRGGIPTGDMGIVAPAVTDVAAIP
jgi:hypothetical protein